MNGQETFYGMWRVKVASKDAAFDQRFRIQGSNAADGTYLGVPNTEIIVDGSAWNIMFEWSGDGGNNWFASGLRRNVATFTDASGLMVELGIDDNHPQFRDSDYNDLIVHLSYMDPAISGTSSFSNPIDFTYDPEGKYFKLPGKGEKDGVPVKPKPD